MKKLGQSYKNVAPLFDLAALTSDDGTCGNQACAAYFTSDCIHYNSAYIESLMGKAFLVMLHKLFANPDAQSPTTPTNLLAAAAFSSQINLAWTASTDD